MTAFLEVDKEVNKAFSALTGFLIAREGKQKVNKEHSASVVSMHAGEIDQLEASIAKLTEDVTELSNGSPDC